ncbi:hypothetical protein F2Q69_00050749 [Brassica cretica]|uniref:Uncharacterized protein n=1 Tax=Brassica cretica TaxID=69181 RepID=A0A8S9PPS9_BRACR|nr:hypothetical protein F2Q69_00050749 [Brassica cretica]
MRKFITAKEMSKIEEKQAEATELLHSVPENYLDKQKGRCEKEDVEKVFTG